MKNTLMRGAFRIAVLAIIGIACLVASHLVPEVLGATGAPMAFGFGLCFAGLAVGDAALRILQPRVDAQDAAEQAMLYNTGAGLVYLGRCILAAVILMLVVTSSRAGQPPAAALPLLPVLKSQQATYWPGMPLPSALGAQVEQETGPCPGRQCWKPTAELRTSREQGVGLGQLTRAFRADGSTRFDALGEIVKSHPKELAGLSWQNRFDPVLQLRALVLKDRQGFELVQGAASQDDRLAMSFAAYNGGGGGLASDRRACAGTLGCDPSKWFGNVERTSLKARAAVPGYGQSFFQINRDYVKNVMLVRRVRYTVLDSA